MGLLGFASDGVCRASEVTFRAVGSYSAVSPLPRTYDVITRLSVSMYYFSKADRFEIACMVNLIFSIPAFYSHTHTIISHLIDLILHQRCGAVYSLWHFPTAPIRYEPSR
jgi:hypothetical protein